MVTSNVDAVYDGHVSNHITINGVKPDPEKVQAIKGKQTPTTVTELQRV